MAVSPKSLAVAGPRAVRSRRRQVPRHLRHWALGSGRASRCCTCSSRSSSSSCSPSTTTGAGSTSHGTGSPCAVAASVHGSGPSKALTNSVEIALVSTVIAIALGTFMAMALVRYRFRGRSDHGLLRVMPLSSPEVVLGAALLGMFLTLNVNTGFVTIVIAHVMFTVSYVVVTVEARLEGMDRHIEEASMDLGALGWTTFRKMTLPMIAPGVAAAAMLAAAISFDNYGQQLVQHRPDADVLAVHLRRHAPGHPGRGQRAGHDAARRRAGPDGHRPARTAVARPAGPGAHRRIEPLTPRSRISLRGPCRREDGACFDVQGWRSRRSPRRGSRRGRAGRRRRAAPAAAGRAWTTVFKPPAGVRDRRADRRPARQSVRARGAASCPARCSACAAETSTVVGNLPGPCNPAGLAFVPTGGSTSPTATASWCSSPTRRRRRRRRCRDRRAGRQRRRLRPPRRLWVSDGGTAQGRVWRIGRDRTAVEVLRVQPLANDVVPGGVGRDVRGLPPGRSRSPERRARLPTRSAPSTSWPTGSRSAATGRCTSPTPPAARSGACYLDHRGRSAQPTGCDTTFTANTLCLDDILVQHPYLDGADGIVLDDDDNICVAANERNAVTVVTKKGRCVEYFRNPPAATRLRNEGPLSSRPARCSSAASYA